jgi:hypothetical protein
MIYVSVQFPMVELGEGEVVNEMKRAMEKKAAEREPLILFDSLEKMKEVLSRGGFSHFVGRIWTHKVKKGLKAVVHFPMTPEQFLKEFESGEPASSSMWQPNNDPFPYEP